MTMVVGHSTQAATAKAVRKATVDERRKFLFEVYSTLSHLNYGGRIPYSRVHQAVARIQPEMRSQFRVDLGYTFAAKNFYGVWDVLLQKDLEILDAEGVVDNHDERAAVISHDLRPTVVGNKLAAVQSWLKGSNYLFDASRRKVQQVLRTKLRSMGSATA